MSKTLTQNVNLDGVLYEAGSTPDKEIADQITNPKAWAEPDADESADDADESAPAAKKTASRRSGS